MPPAMSVSYATVGDRLVREVRNSVITRYVSDPLGSVIQTRNSSGTLTSSTEFWPFGEVRTSTGTNPSPWGFVGTLGYYADLASRLYVRARYYRTSLSRWMTVDPYWPGEPSYVYVDNQPVHSVDPTGLSRLSDFWACMRERSHWNITKRELCVICRHRSRSRVLCDGECFDQPAPPPKAPPKEPKDVTNCIKKCAGKTGAGLRECLKKCGHDKVRDVALDLLFCYLYPEICRQYNGLPCANVHDLDSCQACAEQKHVQCMQQKPPLEWVGCEAKYRAELTKCLHNYPPV